MRRLFSSIAILMLPSALASEVVTSVASGSAYDTGVTTQITQKRAIADALENFMLQSGAKFSSLTIVENGVVKLDQLKVSSENRVLGFNILSEQRDGDKYTVTLKILHGNFEQKEKCPNPHQIRLSYPNIVINYLNSTPHYISNLTNLLREQIKAIANRQKSLYFVDALGITPKNQNTNLADYSSLASAQVAGGKNNDQVVLATNEHSLEILLDLQYNNDSEILTARFWPKSSNVALNANLESVETKARTNHLAVVLPFKMVPRDRSEIVDELLSPFLISLEKSIAIASCAPQYSNLRKSGQYFNINLGREHGVKTDSVFLLQNGQPTGFVVKTLEAKHATLQALEGAIPRSNFDGEVVYLLQ